MPSLQADAQEMGAWALRDGVLTFTHRGRAFFWRMPAGYRMPHPALLELAEFLLLRKLGEDLAPPATTRPAKGRKIAVAYSGGVDSTAAVRLLHRPLPIHTQVANPSRSHKLENALLALEEVGGIAIVTDSDEIPTLHDRRRGFFGKGAWTVPSVLLADHLNLGYVADGDVLETVYLHSAAGHGTKYNPHDHSALLERFRSAGLEYVMPCAGLTEVSTTEIARGARYAMGCVRGVGGEPCRNCAKCYRKSALGGSPIPINDEQQSRLEKDLIPMLPGLLWARDHHGLSHPILDAIEKDAAWAGGWYPPAIGYVPEPLRRRYLRRLRKLGITPMSNPGAVETWISR
ncbi:MAG TPA: DUF6395 domain-containing protein [Ilumatobacter sp.]|nr:DUF6395 domain-containing protein [Ilumatobacter sp.]